MVAVRIIVHTKAHELTAQLEVDSGMSAGVQDCMSRHGLRQHMQ